MAQGQGRNKAISKSLQIDPIHSEIDIYGQQLTQDVWRDKYSYDDEAHPHDTIERIIEGVYALDEDHRAKGLALEAMKQALWIPGGRIWATAGTPKITTMINCYVSRKIDDSMPDIMDALKDAALTQQQGGGIGMDFSTIRPEGAWLSRTGSIASGPIHFMDMWDAMCATIKSAGDRRGAMMATLACDHPDLIDFITAKQAPGRLTNFNVSVLITDAFMDAVKNDEMWHLGFNVKRADGKHIFVVNREDEGREGEWYAYSQHKAKDLWDMILKNTYDYAEPGVLFIDRINDENNLNYIEDIQCTNPCGEQPLPPYACCNLGAVNLARMVKNPFTDQAEFDYSLLKKVAAIGMRFLDNVIDVSIYPLPEQKQEELDKRRTGLGITGLANALAQLKVKYNSEEGVKHTDTIMATLKEAAFEASAKLAEKRGSFPKYIADEWGIGSPVVQSLPTRVRNLIAKHGIRNGVLLTIAPTGTTSIVSGNISGGLEPVFAYEMVRKVRQRNSDTETKSYTAYDYGYLLYKQKFPDEVVMPWYMIEHHDCTPADHLAIQAVCQKHVDASISKTVNCPVEITYEAFKAVYEQAYISGCKGCTTYRPNATRGSVLSVAGEKSDEDKEDVKITLTPRPDELMGKTYKRKWGDTSIYIVINDFQGRPFEMFINSNSSKYADWTNALSLMVSAIMRRGDDISFVPEELKKVASAHDSGFAHGKYYPSMVALIGEVIEAHLVDVDIRDFEEGMRANIENQQSEELSTQITGEMCDNCQCPTLIAAEGCKVCTNCGFSTCGG
ncbi:MAG: ribonucleoside-diphosphate reductase, adenosylcobalamin-dependent [Blastopirellula sp.]|nr:MAG: ribonucleoside-diphosphate reductase, adenosylcobalamin-dependent [Blastopirellula sp.]